MTTTLTPGGRATSPTLDRLPEREDGRLLIRGAAAISMDPRGGDLETGDVLIEGRRIGAVAPDLSHAVADGQALVLDAAATSDEDVEIVTNLGQQRISRLGDLPAEGCDVAPDEFPSPLPMAAGHENRIDVVTVGAEHDSRCDAERQILDVVVADEDYVDVLSGRQVSVGAHS